MIPFFIGVFVYVVLGMCVALVDRFVVAKTPMPIFAWAILLVFWPIVIIERLFSAEFWYKEL